MKHTIALEMLSAKLIELGGKVYQRYFIDYLKRHPEGLSDEAKEKLKTVESMQFFESIMTGKFPKDTDVFDVESCEEYKQMLEVSMSIKVLQASHPTTSKEATSERESDATKKD